MQEKKRVDIFHINDSFKWLMYYNVHMSVKTLQQLFISVQINVIVINQLIM